MFNPPFGSVITVNATTTAPSIFGNTTAPSIFANTTSSSIFVNTTSSAPSSVFSTSFSFGVPPVTKTDDAKPIFGATPTSTNTKPVSFSFGIPNATTTSDSTSAASGSVTFQQLSFGAKPERLTIRANSSKSTSPFGTKPTNTTPPKSTSPINSGLFGAKPISTPTSPSVFGAKPTSTPTTTSVFGAKPTSTQTTTSVFGAKPTTTVPTSSANNSVLGDNPGMSSPSTSTSAFGSVPLNGPQVTKPTGWSFTAQPTITTQAWNAFHSLTTSTTASTNSFSNTPRSVQTGMSGSVGESPKGTAFAKYTPTTDYEHSSFGFGLISFKYQNIVAMQEYLNKSVEELRWEDYIEGRSRHVASADSSVSDFPKDATNMFASPNNSQNSLFDSYCAVLSEKLADSLQQQIDRVINVTEARFNEAYSQQIEQYLTLRNITQLVIKIDKQLDENKSSEGSKSYEEVLKRLEKCELKLEQTESKSDEQQTKLADCEAELEKLKIKNAEMVAMCEQQKKKIEQYEVKIYVLETKLNKDDGK